MQDPASLNALRLANDTDRRPSACSLGYWVAASSGLRDVVWVPVGEQCGVKRRKKSS